MIEYIKSKDNKNIKLAAKVLSGSGAYISVEGLKLIGEALRCRLEITYAFFLIDNKEKFSDLAEKLDGEGAKVFWIEKPLLAKITDTKTPDGALILAKRPALKETGIIEKGKLLLLDNVQDPKNVGAIIRIADAFGLEGVLLSGGCADVFSPKVLRGSMGSAFRINLFKTGIDDIKSLKQRDFSLYASVLNSSAKSLTDISFPDKSVVVIGNEGSGISKEVLEICDNFLYIPMKGEAESLNAAVAAGIIAWELKK